MFKVRVPEDAPPWKDIQQISAQDADTNSKLVYSIHSSLHPDSAKFFHLDPKSGVLVLTEELDYEMIAVHTLIVMVMAQLLEYSGQTAPKINSSLKGKLVQFLRSHQSLSLSFFAPPQVRDQEIPVKRNFVKVVVHVEDCNDHSPAFLSPRYEASISNQAPTGSEVVRVKALDKDMGSNAEISYSLHTGEQQRVYFFSQSFIYARSFLASL